MSESRVAVLGAGPIGLSCAAHLAYAGLPFTVLESGSGPATAVRAWGHVRMFSPWSMNLDSRAVSLLSAHGWEPPAAVGIPTGQQLVEEYLEPLARIPEVSSNIRYGARVTAVARRGRNLVDSDRRAHEPFVVRYVREDSDHDLLATAVIDATGTWGQPNHLGASGIPALGEPSVRDRIHYGIPDVAGADRHRYAGRRILVVGSGHSAANVLTDLAGLAVAEPCTTVTWLVRGEGLHRLLQGGHPDQLPDRQNLGTAVTELVISGAVQLEAGFRIAAVTATGDGVTVHQGARRTGPFDEIVATTGFRPNLAMLAELRLDLDAATQAPRGLATLIDPNTRSCLYVPPHGAEVLAQPEVGFYLVGMKSYGRAPSFLLQTGYGQVRSVVAAVAAAPAGEVAQDAVDALAGAGR
jgi:thioredoxin reductase